MTIPIPFSFSIESIVTEDQTASRVGSGLLPVFATPQLVAFMENCAQLSVTPYMEEGYTTVGTEINVKHIKATPVGMKIYCESVLIKADDRKLVFEIKANDEVGEIGLATHTRYIVNSEKFMEKIKR